MIISTPKDIAKLQLGSAVYLEGTNSGIQVLDLKDEQVDEISSEIVCNFYQTKKRNLIEQEFRLNMKLSIETPPIGWLAQAFKTKAVATAHLHSYSSDEDSYSVLEIYKIRTYRINTSTDRIIRKYNQLGIGYVSHGVLFMGFRVIVSGTLKDASKKRNVSVETGLNALKSW